MRALSRASFAIIALLAACTQTDDSLTLPISHAERAREIKMLVEPPLRLQSREEFTADAQKSADEETDDAIQRQHDAYGRLGFFPRTFDLRAAGGASSALYAAYYSSETKSITVVGSPAHSILVHELVHALQDQQFDLMRVHGEKNLSSDESLARDALIEGDARMAEYRDLLWDRGEDPIAVLRSFVTVNQARNDAATFFGESTLPLIFSAHAAFAYSFGAAFVGDGLFLPSSQWDYKRVNARFAAGDGPKSTQEVIRVGEDLPVDPIVDTGLNALPGGVAAEWVVESVDRMGEWYTYVLLFPGTPQLSALTQLTAGWDGDQLVVLRKKDGSDPPSTKAPSGIVWTTAWDDERAATAFVAELTRVHAAIAVDGPSSKTSAKDGEAIWLEQRDNQVCFVKNLAPAMAAELAHAALYTAAERRFEVLRRPLSKPAIIH